MTYDLNIGAKRVVSDLRELAKLTSDENGAQRVAWTPTWEKARQWFIKKAEDLGAISDIDTAGNIWITIEGESSESISLGSHLDSVPNGGWLDGALGIVVGLEIIRRYKENNVKPKKTIHIINWADEEGARFGRSCFGSAASTGSLNISEMMGRTDYNGIKFEDAVKEYNIDLGKVNEASNYFDDKNIKSYLELHIEQGPVLENNKKDVSCVYGAAGVERHYFDFIGQSSHSGSFPTEMRQDAFLAAAESALSFRKIALKYNAVCTVGQIFVDPNVSTISPGKCTISLDQRSINQDDLDNMFKDAKNMANKAAIKNNLNVNYRKIHSIPAQLFDDELIEICKEAVFEETGEKTNMYSGPLHDAVEVAKVVPTVMMFVMSEKGLSHTKEENTPDEKLEIGIRSFLRLVDKVLNVK